MFTTIKVRSNFFLLHSFDFFEQNYVIHFSFSKNSTNVNTLLMSSELISLSTTQMPAVHLSRDNLGFFRITGIQAFNSTTKIWTSTQDSRTAEIYMVEIVSYCPTLVRRGYERNLDGLGFCLRNRKLWKKTRRGHLAQVI